MAKENEVEETKSSAERAWERYVVTLPCPLRWVGLAERFVRSTRPARPDVTLALVLLCLSLAPDWEALVDGRWVFLTSAHRYIYFAGKGYGDARTYDLLSKLFHWLCEEGEIDEDELGWLLSEIDDGREGVGLRRLHGPRVHERPMWAHQLDDLTERFAGTLDDPFLAELAPAALRVLATRVETSSGELRFARLRVERFVSDLLSPHREHATRDVVGSSRTLLDIASRFYRWLAEQDYLERSLAEGLAGELGMAAFRLVA